MKDRIQRQRIRCFEYPIFHFVIQMSFNCRIRFKCAGRACERMTIGSGRVCAHCLHAPNTRYHDGCLLVAAAACNAWHRAKADGPIRVLSHFSTCLHLQLRLHISFTIPWIDVILILMLPSFIMHVRIAHTVRAYVKRKSRMKTTASASQSIYV